MLNVKHRSTFLSAAAAAAAALALTLTVALPQVAAAHGERAPVPAPASLAVRAVLPPPAAGVTELRFGELFRTPIGPQGLEPSDKLRALDGQRVRLVGYVAGNSSPVPGRLILSPVPVSIGDEDESLADDLPPSAVFVHLSEDAAAAVLPDLAGLVQLTGRLALGQRDEADGRVSSVRLMLDEATSRLLVATRPAEARAPVHQATRP